MRRERSSVTSLASPSALSLPWSSSFRARKSSNESQGSTSTAATTVSGLLDRLEEEADRGAGREEDRRLARLLVRVPHLKRLSSWPA